MIGLEKGIVRLMEYDTEWPIDFTEEKENILKALRTIPLKLSMSEAHLLNNYAQNQSSIFTLKVDL